MLAEELMEGAALLADLVDGDWTDEASWATARGVVEGFMGYWEANRSVFRVVELATEEGDLRFQGLRVRALNAVTVTLARVIAAGQPGPPGGDRSHGGGRHPHLDAGPCGRPPLRVRVLGDPDHLDGGHPGPGAALGRDRSHRTGMTFQPETLHSEPLSESDADADPLVQFAAWFDQASPLVRLPEAMAVATADTHGRPSVRMVLCKGWDERGFVFHTDYTSRKAGDLAVNPVAALLFHWDPLGRQVRIEGSAQKVSAGESDRYFETRPAGADRRPRVGAEPTHRVAPGARPPRGRAHRPLRRRPGPPARVLGRLPGAARGLRVLAEPRRPAPRPAPVHPDR